MIAIFNKIRDKLKTQETIKSGKVDFQTYKNKTSRKENYND